jgi:hypothetical protein
MYAWMGGTRRKMTELAKPKNAELKRQQAHFQRNSGAATADDAHATESMLTPSDRGTPAVATPSYDVRAMQAVMGDFNSADVQQRLKRRTQGVAERQEEEIAMRGVDEPAAKRPASAVRASCSLAFFIMHALSTVPYCVHPHSLSMHDA